MAIPVPALLPKVLAGPILRRVTKTRVAVWVVMRMPATITLNVFDSNQQVRASGSTDTQPIGSNLYLALVDAVAPSALSEGVIYSYNLTFVSFDGSTISGDLTTPGNFSRPGDPFLSNMLSYAVAGFSGLPTFVLPQSNLSSLRLAHVSCRKPHADSIDTFELLDNEIKLRFQEAANRPQQLFLTGDQIYADDVADSLLSIIKEVAAAFVGSEELVLDLPITDPQLKVGGRTKFVKETCGFTPEGNIGKSHILTFGEYCAMYLLVWSDALWPTRGCTRGAAGSRWTRQ